ncbi:MAM domain-containing glycosylphosphatidylinositol anchor protein 1-like isoform X3 [Lethenteron reissneri]|uniref:MAM domain-containing glycosylphosphatidylinositol anchor protein 1-like isoform X3 n=1 Tax=Lethenteron reissneri TaxID=7753 RepID=UPI002AB75990|nr:MAM domain-containing glycosylphosphatidylinositol anchor protein 1-like isoform X3 [Lethenteron reissneri]
MRMHFYVQGLAVFGKMWIGVICLFALRHHPEVAAEVAWGVNYGPKVVTCPGSTVILPCSFAYPESDGSEVTRAVWKKGYAHSSPHVYSLTAPVASYKDRMSLVGDLKENNCSLKIIDVNSYDASTYFFRFAVTKGFTGAGGITLEVKYPYIPRYMKVKFDPDKVTEGMNVTVMCESDSWPPAHNVTWVREMRNGHKESLATFGERITIRRVQVEDSGWYHCTATNTKGSGSSYKHLQVLCRGGVDSSVTYGAKVVHVTKGAQAMLPCSFCTETFIKSSHVEGYWLLNDARDFENFVYRVSAKSTRIMDYQGRVSLPGDLTARNCSLLIEDIRISDANTYFFYLEVDRKVIVARMGIELKVTAVPDSMLAQQDVPALAIGKPASLSCSVANVYPRGSINITWCEDVITGGVITKTETALPDGTFNITSRLNFTPSADHYVKKCPCSVGGVNLPSMLQETITLHYEDKDHLDIVKLVAVGVVALGVLFILLIILLILRRRRRDATDTVPSTLPQKQPRTLENENAVTYSKVSFMRKGPRVVLENPRREDQVEACCGPADGQTTHPEQASRPSGDEDGAGPGYGRDGDECADVADECAGVGDDNYGGGVENEGDIVYATLSFGNPPEKD